MLIRKIFKCSVDVKCYLFKTYCSTMYCSAMWFDTTKSASEMFAALNIPSFGELLRKFAFSLCEECVLLLMYSW